MTRRTVGVTAGSMHGLVVVVAVLLASPTIAAERLPLAGATVEACFTPGEDCAGVVVAAIGEALHSVRVLAYGFTAPRILAALVDARRRGVDVRLVLDGSNLKDRYSKAREAAAAGITVRIDSSVAIAHSKVVLVDDALVLTGSYNFTVSANRRNAENLLIVRGSLPLAKRMRTFFEERERVSEPLRLP